MKSDVIVLGAELDGLLAAARLVQQGLSVQMLCTGAGGLHYAPAGLHVLGYHAGENKDVISDPLSAISALSPQHPYRKIGLGAVAGALRWYSELSSEIGLPAKFHEENTLALTPAGLGLPILGATPHLATLEACEEKTVTVVCFQGMRDFPVELTCAGLSKTSRTANAVEAALPGKLAENVALAKSFDTLADLSGYFAALGQLIPAGTDMVFFPAVMGLRRSVEIMSTAEDVLGLPCFEISTLPTSVPGLRLELALREHLHAKGVDCIANFEPNSAFATSKGVILTDAYERRYEADVAILATGGVLMGGLEVQSNGRVRERLFGLDVVQTGPLSVAAVDLTLDALHKAGVETNEMLNPIDEAGQVTPTLFVTGQTLAHSNPAAESSADGVSITTGWAAAEQAQAYLKGTDNG